MLTRQGREWKKFQSSDSCMTDLKEKSWMAAVLQPWSRRAPLTVPEVPCCPGCSPLHSQPCVVRAVCAPQVRSLESALTAREQSGQSCARRTGKDHHGRRNSHDQLAWPGQATALPQIPVWTTADVFRKKAFPSELDYPSQPSVKVVPMVNYPTL